MKLNKENLEKIFNFIDNQISDVSGEFDEETPILTAVESIFNKNIDNVLRSNSTSFKECKATLHKHNQCSHHQQEKLQ